MQFMILHIRLLVGWLQANRQLIRKITKELNIIEEVGWADPGQTRMVHSASQEVRTQVKPACLSLGDQLSRALSNQEGKEISKDHLWNTHSSGPRDSN